MSGVIYLTRRLGRGYLKIDHELGTDFFTIFLSLSTSAPVAWRILNLKSAKWKRANARYVIPRKPFGSVSGMNGESMQDSDK